MKIKIEVNLELGLLEYSQQHPETTVREIPWLPSGTLIPDYPEAMQADTHMDFQRTVH